MFSLDSNLNVGNGVLEPKGVDPQKYGSGLNFPSGKESKLYKIVQLRKLKQPSRTYPF